MRIEILTIDDCPNAALTRERVAGALASEQVNAQVEHVVVSTRESARRTKFIGSPSVRVNGEDVEAQTQAREVGLMCRTYLVNGRTEGAPSEEVIRAAVRRKASQTERDMARNLWSATWVWLLPIAVLIISGFFTMSTPVRGAIWTLASAAMGIGCLVNAARCGRMHCYFTGPFLLIMAFVAALFGAGVLPASNHSWNDLGMALAAGFIVLYFVPEVVFGRYARRHAGT